MARNLDANLTIDAVLRTSLPVARLVNSLSEAPSVDNERGKKRKNASTTSVKTYASRELHQTLATETPYGTLSKTMTIGDEGNTMDFQYACPFAYMHHLSTLNEQFGEFLETHVGEKKASVAFYMDEVTPGNPLRPDNGRRYQAIYWTIQEVPSWLRTRRHAFGWFTFAFIQSQKLIDCGITPSVLMKHILNVFWSPTENNSNLDIGGCILKSVNHFYNLHAKFSCFIADEKAIKEVYSVKGASGSKPCLWCSNVVGRTTEAVPGNVHVHAADMDLCEQHSPDSYNEMVRRLVELVGRGAPAREIQALEQIFGLKFEAGSILFEDYTRRLAKPPHSAYWDWMHCLVSSGGIAQYEINQLVRQLKTIGVNPDDIDTFSRTIVWPKSASRLPTVFFKKRCVDKPESHIRAFAGETLSAVVALGAFADAVVKPLGLLPEFTACFDMLRNIVDILQKGEGAFLKMEVLKKAMRDHHIMYLELYPLCAKPKLHYLRHIPECLERHGVSLSCFASERKHKQSKMIATFCYKNYTKSMIAYDIRNVTARMKNPHLFEEMHLSGTEKSVPLLPEWTRAGISEVVSARALCTPKSTFFCGDVLLSMQNGSMSAGRAIAFLRITQGLPRQRGRELRYLALLENMQKIVGAIYTLSGGDPVLTKPAIFFASVPFRRVDATFHLALPTVLPV